MSPSQRWSRLSTGMIICARIFPRHGGSLLHVARLIDEYVIESLDERVLAEACELGASPSDLDFILPRTTPNWHKVVRVAAKGGHLHVCRWMGGLQDVCGPWEGDFYCAVDEAALYGHFELIKWLHGRGFGCIGTDAFSDAACYGNLAMLKWLHEHTPDLRASEVDTGMRYAAGRGHLATVQWIYEEFKDSVQLAPAMAGAARYGELDILQWLHQQKSCSEACSTKAMDAAIGGGHLGVVEWLFENCSKAAPAM